MRNFAHAKFISSQEMYCAVMALNIYPKAFNSFIFIHELLLGLKQREERNCRQFTAR